VTSQLVVRIRPTPEQTQNALAVCQSQLTARPHNILLYAEGGQRGDIGQLVVRICPLHE
jgi:hypothetical protein